MPALRRRITRQHRAKRRFGPKDFRGSSRGAKLERDGDSKKSYLSLEPALGPDKALDRAGSHEEKGLTVGCMALNDLLRRNENPLLIEPRVPPVFRVLAISGFHSELRFDDIGDAAAIQRLVATRRAQMVVGRSRFWNHSL
jgi:hypothetical protein